MGEFGCAGEEGGLQGDADEGEGDPGHDPGEWRDHAGGGPGEARGAGEPERCGHPECRADGGGEDRCRAGGHEDPGERADDQTKKPGTEHPGAGVLVDLLPPGGKVMPGVGEELGGIGVGVEPGFGGLGWIGGGVVVCGCWGFIARGGAAGEVRVGGVGLRGPWAGVFVCVFACDDGVVGFVGWFFNVVWVGARLGGYVY